MKCASLLVTGLLAGGLLLTPELARADHDDYGGESVQRIGWNRGYQDGFDHGAKDGDHHKDFNFWHEKRYRKADSGYRSWCGPKYPYQQAYRSGYEQGYRRAYAYAHSHHRDRSCSWRNTYTRPRPWDDDYRTDRYRDSYRDWDDDRDWRDRR